jgi:hypothetical protein
MVVWNCFKLFLVQDSVVDAGIRCLLDPWIRDPRQVKKRGYGSGPGMNNPNNLSKRWETYFVVKIFKLLDADVKNLDPGWKNSDTD